MINNLMIKEKTQWSDIINNTNSIEFAYKNSDSISPIPVNLYGHYINNLYSLTKNKDMRLGIEFSKDGIQDKETSFCYKIKFHIEYNNIEDYHNFIKGVNKVIAAGNRLMDELYKPYKTDKIDQKNKESLWSKINPFY